MQSPQKRILTGPFQIIVSALPLSLWLLQSLSSCPFNNKVSLEFGVCWKKIVSQIINQYKTAILGVPKAELHGFRKADGKSLTLLTGRTCLKVERALIPWKET